MATENKQLPKARQALVDRVLEELEQGKLPWDSGMTVALPQNLISQKQYRGINLMSLYLTALKRGVTDPRWATFNQISEAGYKVKRGAKGVPIELYKRIDKRTGKEADYDAVREEVKDMSYRERYAFEKENIQTLVRSYYVFNGSDVEGLEPYKPHVMDEREKTQRNERIEKILAENEAPIFYDGFGGNYYDPLRDEIHLTDRTGFKTMEGYYLTTLHELGHSTGHVSRLNRKFGESGDEVYAREELVAELASVFSSAELGLSLSDREFRNSVAYIQAWKEIIQEHPQTFIDATFDANRAADYLCNADRHKQKSNADAIENKTETMSNSVQDREDVKEKYVIDLKLDYSNEMLLSKELEKMGYSQDISIAKMNLKKEAMAFEKKIPYWLNEMRYIGQDGKTIHGLYGMTNNGIMIKATDINRFTLEGLTKEEAKQFSDILHERFGIEATLKPQTDQKKNTSGATAEEAHMRLQETIKDNNIPEAMRVQSRWCAFKAEKTEDGKTVKQLFDCNQSAPRGRETKYLKWAKSTEAGTWTTYENAKNFVKLHKLDGVAFALSGSGITCIDLDHSIDEQGNVSPFAQKVLQAAGDTYTERSVSGRGIHVFYAGSAPENYLNRNDKIDLEVYDSKRIMCVTGDARNKSKTRILPLTQELTDLLKENLSKVVEYTQPMQSLNLTDTELIEKIRSSKRGGEFDRLWAGEDIKGNRSVSDMALCNMLAFFSGGNADQVERVFRASGMYRPSKGDGYVKRTAEKACATLTKTYDPASYRRSGSRTKGASK